MMRYLATLVVLVACSLAGAETGRFTTWLDEWKDTSRQRVVPVKVYEPVGDGPFPIIVFSHGLGGARENYGYLGEYWAARGYVCVHVQHHGSDDAVWRNVRPAERMRSMSRATMDPDNLINRPKDVSFAIDTLEKLNASGPRLRGKLDVKHIGVAGHSFGAYTTMAIAGQSFAMRTGPMSQLADPRVTAAIAMSTPVPSLSGAASAVLYRDRFKDITIPVMHMTGTHDTSVIGDTKAQDRRIPFDHSDGGPGREQYLIIFKGGDHMLFSGRIARLGDDTAADKVDHALIQQATTAFWDAYLRDDEAAKATLLGGAMQKTLSAEATLEIKR